MQLKIIRTKKDYLKSLKRFEEIFLAKAGSPESDEADVLSIEELHISLETLVREY